MSDKTVNLSVDGFGSVEDPITKVRSDVKRFTWTNGNKVKVQMISYGAMMTSILVPDKNGKLDDVALGFDSIEGYTKDGNPAYIGSLMGRVANRVGNAEFTLHGEKYSLAKNFVSKHSLHGGIIGFDKCNWDSYVSDKTVYLTHVSPDGYEGYPGTVIITVACKLSDDNAFSMSMRASTSKPTPINLSNHSYFNLAGHAAGHEELYKHVLTINADKTLKIDAEQIPTGDFNCVGDTVFDFRLAKQLGSQMTKAPSHNFDHNFCIVQGSEQDLTFHAKISHPDSGRFMEVYSDQPSVLLYTGNNLPDPNANINPPDDGHDSAHGSTNVTAALAGKGGAEYTRHGAFCLETQKYPDAVHHDNFPSTILNPGEIYKHEFVMKFGVDQRC